MTARATLAMEHSLDPPDKHRAAAPLSEQKVLSIMAERQGTRASEITFQFNAAIGRRKANDIDRRRARLRSPRQ
jgi:hypothetical protein